MALDLQEQQELDNFKYWWRKWGRWLTVAFFVAAAAYLGMQIQQERSKKAMDQAYKLSLAAAQYGLGEKSSPEALKRLKLLQENFSGSPYAAVSSLSAAKAYAQEGKADEAEKHARWALQTSKDALAKSAAALSLAKIAAQKGDAEAAKAAVAQATDPAVKWAAQETLGDVYMDKGQAEAAADAYAAALKSLLEAAPDLASRPTGDFDLNAAVLLEMKSNHAKSLAGRPVDLSASASVNLGKGKITVDQFVAGKNPGEEQNEAAAQDGRPAPTEGR